MSQINISGGEKPERLWYIDRRNNLSRNEHFSGSPDDFIKELKVVNKTPAGWRGICVTFNPNSTYDRVYNEKNYIFFSSKDEARKYLLMVLAKRHESLTISRNRCGEMISEIMRLRDEQN